MVFLKDKYDYFLLKITLKIVLGDQNELTGLHIWYNPVKVNYNDIIKFTICIFKKDEIRYNDKNLRAINRWEKENEVD